MDRLLETTVELNGIEPALGRYTTARREELAAELLLLDMRKVTATKLAELDIERERLRK